ncbi:MAG: hypothetical protein PUA75_09400 [Clostridiales bacterium]|nr:hypothetical protein [Clostridiales bacterium]
MNDFEKKTSPRKKIDTESWFIESYRQNQGHPMRILVSLYKGNYHKFVLAVICFFIKHACVWVLPIITANIINDVTMKNPDTVRNIIFYAGLEVTLIAINIPMNYYYTSYKSLATRYVETGLRKALIRKPSVIVLDEATSALDSISEKLIQEALGNLTKGRTTFIVAHRLSTIRDADKIAVIADGHCVEYGTFEELMELKGEFYRMKVMQS